VKQEKGAWTEWKWTFSFSLLQNVLVCKGQYVQHNVLQNSSDDSKVSIMFTLQSKQYVSFIAMFGTTLYSLKYTFYNMFNPLKPRT
jgi:hypothetical protein